jgi:hypothetical protein
VTGGVPALLLCIGLLASAPTGPSQLVDRMTPAGERVAYGTRGLRFGELRLPHGPVRIRDSIAKTKNEHRRTELRTDYAATPNNLLMNFA